MRKTWIMAGAVALVAGCASGGPPTGPDETTARAAACETTTERIYFEPEMMEVPPAATPILNAVVARIRDCEAQGGRLVAINVVAFPDSSETGPDADDIAHERAGQVRDALVDLGVNADKVTLIRHREVAEDPNRVLRRHATIGIILE